MKSLILVVCLLVGLTSCKESIYSKQPYSVTLQQCEVITTDTRLPVDHPRREFIEVAQAGLICVTPEVQNTYIDEALSCEKELKKLRRTCKPQ